MSSPSLNTYWDLQSVIWLYVWWFPNVWKVFIFFFCICICKCTDSGKYVDKSVYRFAVYSQISQLEACDVVELHVETKGLFFQWDWTLFPDKNINIWVPHCIQWQHFGIMGVETTVWWVWDVVYERFKSDRLQTHPLLRHPLPYFQLFIHKQHNYFYIGTGFD